ncbi:BA75_02473T0 [Komagataella pastoris]|uniref:BA75_02473T0 n=1 Tax=Komagataella pastoris TaxID=4922 RepID=A0A1B2JDI3_PICPA|nr:BA75_02473T0 [Komagataella pastoris]
MEDNAKVDNVPDPETKSSIALELSSRNFKEFENLDDALDKHVSNNEELELPASEVDQTTTTILESDSEVEGESQPSNISEIEAAPLVTGSNVNALAGNRTQASVGGIGHTEIVAEEPVDSNSKAEVNDEPNVNTQTREEGNEEKIEESKEESKDESMEESKENVIEGATEHVTTSKPKRLTLQERLKLAAQTKAKKRREQNEIPGSALGTSFHGAESPSSDLTDSEALKINAPVPSRTPISTPVTAATPSSTPSSYVNNRDSVINNLQKKLEAKEIQVKELLEEGMKLSSNEVSLLQTVKRLKQENNSLVNELNNVSEINRKLEIRSQRLDALEKEFIKGEDLASKYDQLKNEFQQKEKELRKLQVKETNLDNKLHNANQEIRELSEKNIHLQSSRDQALSELRECELLLTTSKAEAELAIKKLKEEILSLEERIEVLRVANENSKQFEKSDNLENYEQLQQEFSNSQENWKLIEDSYIHKISSLESDISSSKTKEQQSGKQVKALSLEIKELSRDNTRLINDIQVLSKEIGLLRKELDSKNTEIQALNETLENKVNTFDLEKKRLIRKLEVKKSPSSEPGTLPDSFSRERSLGDISTTSITSSLNPTNSSSHNSFQLGESSSRRISTTSIFDNNFTNDSDARTIEESNLPTNHTMDMLTSQLRSLELQISKLKTENKYLAEEKKELTQEIVKLMKLNENSKAYHHEIEILNQQLQDSKTEYEKALVLLGEKSELVEELRADVEDLKDICKQQVRDMVKLTSK